MRFIESKQHRHCRDITDSHARAVLDPFSEDFIADPHAVFDALRPAGPVVRDPIGWSTIDYATCDATFHDPALVPGIDHLLEHRGIEHLWGVPDRTLTDSEGDAHKRLRRAVSPWFSARRIAELRVRTRELVAGLLAERGPTEPIDVMADVADVVPAQLFVWMVGAPSEDAPALARLSKALLSVFTATEAMVEPVRAAKAELATYTEELLAAHASRPGGDDVTAALLDATRSGALHDGDAFYLLEELLSASVDNTANTAALTLYTLATQGDWWTRLHRDPGLLDRAVEECGRFEPAIRHTIKAAVAPTTVGGVEVSAGEFVTVRIAAAHRDPQAFPDPHAFDPMRDKARPQLSFGAGRHYCLGAALGRMEVAEITSAITAGWSSASVLDGFDADIAISGVVRSLPMAGVPA